MIELAPVLHQSFQLSGTAHLSSQGFGGQREGEVVERKKWGQRCVTGGMAGRFKFNLVSWLFSFPNQQSIQELYMKSLLGAQGMQFVL